MRSKVIGRNSHNTVSAVGYRAGIEVRCEKTGELFNYANKKVDCVALLLPDQSPEWAKEIGEVIEKDRTAGVQKLVDMVESFEKRKDAQVWREVEFSLPRELTNDQGLSLARDYLVDQFCKRGMGVLLNAHLDVDPGTGERKPHIHALVFMREMTDAGFGKKNRDWNDKGLHETWREQLAAYTNFHLKMHGVDQRIDHRSYKDRGIDLIPQPKLGKNVAEMAQRAGSSIREGFDLACAGVASTDKGQAWQKNHLSNLYKIISNPDVVFDLVMSKQSTFVWTDVQKALLRYVNDPVLFKTLDQKLQGSSQLVVLTGAGDGATYTTKGYVTSETVLGALSERLGSRETHGVDERLIAQGIAVADADLKEKHGLPHGLSLGLSADQKAALSHLCSAAQLSCVVGYAGAGKSTALSVAQGIWESAGYRVYGFAPTGKAAQGLSLGGMPSQTLYKFLRDFESGRSQYGEQSVLVLDEGGMVPVGQMKDFLTAVHSLGVKAVVVGDGAQLQPIEAGPAFRKVTASVGTSTLETIVRQKESWQQAATQAFGRQETSLAVQAYVDRGYVHLSGSEIPTVDQLEKRLGPDGSPALDRSDVLSDVLSGVLSDVQRLEKTAQYLSGLIYGQMSREVAEMAGEGRRGLVTSHHDYGRYRHWQETASFCSAMSASLLKSQDVPAPENITEKFDLRTSARQEMLRDWRHSMDTGAACLMMAQSRHDVHTLNEMARHHLQQTGVVDRQEYVHQTSRPISDDFGRMDSEEGTRSFAKGDQILFLKNDRGLGVQNGSVGTITAIDRHKITATLHNTKSDTGDMKTVSFATTLYNAIDYGWAATIHKNQGFTADRAFYLASPHDSRNLAYVAMTRHRESVQVYGSKEEFGSAQGLVKSLSQSREKLLASDYAHTPSSLKDLYREDASVLTRAFDTLENHWTAFKVVGQAAISGLRAQYLGVEGSYSSAQSLTQSSAQSGDISIRDMFQNREGERARDVLNLNLVSSSSSSPASSTGIKEQDLSPPADRLQVAPEPSPRYDFKALNAALNQDAKSVAHHLLGDCNASLSSAKELRYGSKGSLCVTINGSRQGQWFDFEKGSGGTLFTLIQETRGVDFKEALSIADTLTNGSVRDLAPFVPHEKFVGVSESHERQAKIEKAQALYAGTKEFSEEVIGAAYLSSRGLHCSPGSDVRIGEYDDYQTGKNYLTLVAFARDSQGNVTGGQQIILDHMTDRKADIDVNKRSFGVIKGSAVILQEDTTNTGRTFMAEGVETALSIKEAGFEGKIIATLGIYNFKNYLPSEDEKQIIICGDNDGERAQTEDVLAKATSSFEEQGLDVHQVKPDASGKDFNDLLHDSGAEAITRQFAAQSIEQIIGPQHDERSSLPEAQKMSLGEDSGSIDYAEIIRSTRIDMLPTMLESLVRKIERGPDTRGYEDATRDLKGIMDVLPEVSSYKHEKLQTQYPELAQRIEKQIMPEKENDRGFGMDM